MTTDEKVKALSEAIAAVREIYHDPETTQDLRALTMEVSVDVSRILNRLRPPIPVTLEEGT